jgi:glucose 1-dehydrogenase
MTAFAGKVAWITGAARGIGAATARAFAERGASVLLTDLADAEPAADAIQRETARPARALALDVTDLAAVERVVDEGERALGPIDILVTAAVYSHREPFHTMPPAEFQRTLDVSLHGVWHCLRTITSRWLASGRRGSAVLVSSPHAVVPVPNCMPYNIAKAGIDMMARTAAVELLRSGIRVNSFHPGWTDTPGERKFFSDERLAEIAGTLPLGRLATAEEMARGILFLADDRSAYATGSVMVMDGGLNLPWNRYNR